MIVQSLFKSHGIKMLKLMKWPGLHQQMIRRMQLIGNWKNKTLPTSKNFKPSPCMPAPDGRATFGPTLKMDGYHQILRKLGRSRNGLPGSRC